MTGRVQDKVALVTGGASGLGEACVVALEREGATVVIADVAEDRGQKLADALPHAHFMKLDVRDEANWQQVVGDVKDKFGRLDILVNNAGLFRANAIEDVTLEEFRAQHQVMTEGVFLGCKTALGPMSEGGGGSIINMSSVAATKGPAMATAYSGAKGAIISMSRSVATTSRERGLGVRCNAVQPAAFDTPMLDYARGALSDGGGEVGHIERELLGRPEDVAYAVLFLASDESRWISGTTLLIDNGASAGV